MPSYVRNNSSSTIFYKPETNIGEYKNDGAYPLEGGLDLYMRVDGIKTPTTGEGNVVKVPNYHAVEIDADGNPNVVNFIFEKAFGYGEIKRPDDTWTNLEESIR